LPEERPLPRAGKLGALLKTDKDQVTISNCFEDSACKAVGIKAGDQITAIDSKAINNTADLQMALWDKRPGDTINIDTVRKRLLLPDKTLSYELTLQ